MRVSEYGCYTNKKDISTEVQHTHSYLLYVLTLTLTHHYTDCYQVQTGMGDHASAHPVISSSMYQFVCLHAMTKDS